MSPVRDFLTRPTPTVRPGSVSHRQHREARRAHLIFFNSGYAQYHASTSLLNSGVGGRIVSSRSRPQGREVLPEPLNVTWL